ncbi:MAG: hypothetical protein E6I80_28160 [Chloroflexi bacterium]|nr:MAG: hypothetical protein E6I80_28160 [Chloroflexota bacterium]
MAVPPSDQSVEDARAVMATSTATPTSVAAAPTSDDQRLEKALPICFLARSPLGNEHPLLKSTRRMDMLKEPIFAPLPIPFSASFLLFCIPRRYMLRIGGRHVDM